ncbi:MAG: hypothetical protein RIK87_23925 [Fuerstiella sp.]
MTDNPYRVSDSGSEPTGGGLMSVRVVAFILAVGGVGALVGAAAGVSLAVLIPSYYEQIFSSGSFPNFSPVPVGLGLGATQGFGGGVVVGTVLAVADRWLTSRQPRQK